MLADIVNTMFLYKRPTIGPSLDIAVGDTIGVQEFFQQGLYLVQNMGPNIVYMRMHHDDGTLFTLAPAIPISGQDETSYDNTPTTEGTFSGGTGYNAADVITMSDGSVVTVDHETLNVVDQFTVDSANSVGGVSPTDVLTQVSVTPAGGSGFTLTLDTDNIELRLKEMPLFPYGSGDMSSIPIQIGLRDVKNVTSGIQGGHPPDLKYLHSVCAAGESATLRATRLTKD